MSQFMYDPTNEHHLAALKIIKCIKTAQGQGLYFKKHADRTIKIFVDVDWTGSRIDMRSTTRYDTYFWGNLVIWRSKKQPVVARRSAEVELKTLALGFCEGLWIKEVLEELKHDVNFPMKILCQYLSN